MNAATLILLAASATPQVTETDSVVTPSPLFMAVVRGQTPTYDEPPVFTAPDALQAPTYPDGSSPLIYDAPPPVGGPAFVGPGFSYGGWYVGYENVFLKPYFTADAAYDFVADDFSMDKVVDFDWDLKYTPRVWVGYASPQGLGAQARYWQIDVNEQVSAADTAALGGFFGAAFNHGPIVFAVTTADGESINARHDLEIHVLDVEGTWHSNLSTQGAISVTAGLRISRMEQDYAVEILDAVGTELGRIDSGHDFRGAGPTISLLGRRRIGNSNWALFANGRLSALFGERSLTMKGVNVVTALPADWSTEGDGVLPISELQLGVEWSHYCYWMGGTRLFLRAALEGQVWFDAGTGMNTTANLGHNTAPDYGDLGLLGFTISTGLTY